MDTTGPAVFISDAQVARRHEILLEAKTSALEPLLKGDVRTAWNRFRNVMLYYEETVNDQKLLVGTALVNGGHLNSPEALAEFLAEYGTGK